MFSRVSKVISGMKWVKDFFRFTKENFEKLQFWSNLLKKHLMENINFRAALVFVKIKRGITKPCTHLHPAPSSSTQLILTSTQLHPPPPSSFQPPPSSLQQPRQYLNQNIARSWAISSNLVQKIKSCPF